MRNNHLYAAALAASLLVGTGSVALAQATDTEPGPVATEGVGQDDDDGFDLGWLGLIGLAGLLGLRKPKHETHVVNPANRPRV